MKEWNNLYCMVLQHNTAETELCYVLKLLFQGAVLYMSFFCTLEFKI